MWIGLARGLATTRVGTRESPDAQSGGVPQAECSVRIRTCDPGDRLTSLWQPTDFGPNYRVGTRETTTRHEVGPVRASDWEGSMRIVYWLSRLLPLLLA